jgi:diguanylate cyclase (GGDEF)-like protein
VARRIQAAVAALSITHPDSTVAPIVTVPLGVVTVRPRPEEGSEALVQAADGALYRAKETGRNRICVASPPGVPAPGP